MEEEEEPQVVTRSRANAYTRSLLPARVISRSDSDASFNKHSSLIYLKNNNNNNNNNISDEESGDEIKQELKQENEIITMKEIIVNESVENIDNFQQSVEIRAKHDFLLVKSPKEIKNERKVKIAGKRAKRCMSEKGLKDKITFTKANSEPDAEKKQRLQKMRHSIKELIDTESIYIKDLYTMIDKIMKPMSEKRNYLTGEPLVTKEQFNSIWSNITVLPNFNEVLLKELIQAAEEEDFQAKIGKVFIDIADYLKIYTTFCSNQPISNQTLIDLRSNSQFDAFLMEKADVTVLEESHNLDLNAFLIKPIQRICKYPLFLREIVNSSKSHDIGFILLEQAYEKINAVILSINEAKKLTENNAKLRDITQILYKSPTIMIPSRRVIRYEMVKKIVTNKSQFKGTLFLFSDSLFVGKNSKGKQRKVKYVTHLFINPNATAVLNDDDPTSCSFTFTSNNAQVTCQTENVAARDYWIADINEAVKAAGIAKNSRSLF